MRMTSNSPWRTGIAGLAMVVLAGCAHGSDGLKLSAGDTDGTVTSTTGAPETTTPTSELSSSSTSIPPSTSTTRAPQPTTTTASRTPGPTTTGRCSPRSFPSTTTTGGAGGS